VVEAVVEDLEIKRKVFQELESRTKPDAFLATNTSSLLVEQMQAGATRPERIGGLHFFNPVHKMPLVEVIQAPKTAEAVSSTLTQWAASVGKTPVLVKDSPGFVVNRILFPYLNEAGMLVAEGMPVEIVDRVMRRFREGQADLLIATDVAAYVLPTESTGMLLMQATANEGVAAERVLLGLDGSAGERVVRGGRGCGIDGHSVPSLFASRAACRSPASAFMACSSPRCASASYRRTPRSRSRSSERGSGARARAGQQRRASVDAGAERRPLVRSYGVGWSSRTVAVAPGGAGFLFSSS